MTALRQALDNYLALRRALGTALYGPGLALGHFVDFLDAHRASFITTEMALRWATAPAHLTPAGRARRLGEVRRFAAWQRVADPRTQIPSQALLPDCYRRRPPYIYTDEEIERIIDQAMRFPSPKGLRGRTYGTLFGLLASTGLRLGEALALDRDDVDLDAGVIAVRRAKFGKSRFVPIHDSTCCALRRYAKQRDQQIRPTSQAAFFLSEGALRISQDAARYHFMVISRAIGLRPPGKGHRHGHGPRLHDMRHRFAVKVIIRWYREGRDVERELPKLSTYLGHVHVADTYWYIESVPELLQLATERATNIGGRAP